MRKHRENERKASMRSEGKTETRSRSPAWDWERAGSKVGSRTDSGRRKAAGRQSAALTEVHLQGPERW